MSSGRLYKHFTRSAKPPSTLIILFPGNPGIPAYYQPFVHALQARLPDDYEFIISGHVGHVPGGGGGGDHDIRRHRLDDTPYTLDEQVTAKVEWIKSLTAQHDDEDDGQSPRQLPRIALIGHSVGAEMVVQALRRLGHDAHDIPAFLLFPTLSHIADTPNGHRLAPIFRAPGIHLLPILAWCLYPLIRLVQLVQPWIASMTPSSSSSIYTPHPVTLSLLASSRTIRHVLHLAASEMKTIRDPDLEWYATNRDRIWSYWGNPDGWVGTQGESIKRVLRDTTTMTDGAAVDKRRENGQVVECLDNIPHAFCLGEFEWLI